MSITTPFHVFTVQQRPCRRHTRHQQTDVRGDVCRRSDASQRRREEGKGERESVPIFHTARSDGNGRKQRRTLSVRRHREREQKQQRGAHAGRLFQLRSNADHSLAAFQPSAFPAPRDPLCVHRVRCRRRRSTRRTHRTRGRRTHSTQGHEERIMFTQHTGMSR